MCISQLETGSCFSWQDILSPVSVFWGTNGDREVILTLSLDAILGALWKFYWPLVEGTSSTLLACLGSFCFLPKELLHSFNNSRTTQPKLQEEKETWEERVTIKLAPECNLPEREVAKFVWVPINIWTSIYRWVTERKWETEMSTIEGDEIRKTPTIQANFPH